MKRKFVFGLACLLTLSTSVKAADFSEDLKKIAPNNVIEIPAIKPTQKYDMGEGMYYYPEAEYYLTDYVETVLGKNINRGYYFASCNDSLDECSLIASDYEDDTQQYVDVKVKWANYDENIKKEADKLAANLEAKKTNEEYAELSYDLKDLALFNYWNHVQEKDPAFGGDLSANYVKELNDEFKNSKFSYHLQIYGGSMSDLLNIGVGALFIKYDGIIYNSVDLVRINQVNVLYVPDNTKDDSIISAAEKRLKDYLKTDVKIEVAGKISEYFDQVEEEKEQFGDLTKMGENYYKTTINGHEIKFLVEKNSSLVKTPALTAVDPDSKITVSTSASVPLDTVVRVKEIVKNSEQFNKIKDVLKTDKLISYDITLYSETLGKNITKLDDGYFQVTIPLGKEYVGKEMAAYYVGDNNKVEEYLITMDKDGNASFTTNHFSIYSIAERSDVTVPSTLDNIGAVVVTGVISLFVLAGSVVLLKKQK